MKYETESWPFVQAKHFKKVDPAHPRAVRVIVIHDMEAPEKGETAENVAKYFATTDTTASAHICVDNNSIVQCVHDRDVAYAAPNCNHDGVQIELAGYGKQTREQWLDDYSKALLAKAADATAQYCLKYDLPVKHLSTAELRAGAKGIVGHFQVSDAYHNPTNHRDPGPNFPWDYFMPLVQQAYDRRK